MKSCTDLKQSQILAKILSHDTADLRYTPFGDTHPWFIVGNILEYDSIPCWSLAALLDVLPYSQLSKDKLGGDKEGWMVSVYPDNCRHDSCWHDNPIDACMEMALKLYELKLL